MNRCLIRFKPVETFFFGGEVTFGDGANQNYLVKSNPFPQQTAILGTIRKALLIQKGYLRLGVNGYALEAEKKDEIEALIGPESFDISKQSQSFGVIKKISPVFLCREAPGKDREYFVTAPLSRGPEFSDKTPGRAMLNSISKPFIPHLKGYDSEEMLQDSLLGAHGQVKEAGAVFKEIERVGITKGKRGVTEEKALYKQTAYRLGNKSFEFACIVEFETDLEAGLVYMGADRSAFMMSVEAIEQTFEEIFDINHDRGRIVLLSDAYVENGVYDLCRFAVTRLITFRNIKSSTGNYAFRKERKLHTFLKKGSVLYVEDAKRSKVADMLNNNHLQAIGYNIFV